MATSTGRQARLSNRWRIVADNGRGERSPNLQTEPPPARPPAKFAGGGSPCPPAFVDGRSSNDGGDDTNKSLSLSLWLAPFSGESRRSTSWSGEQLSRGGSLRPLLLPPPRLSSIRSVFRRRRWITGLADGLRVGLPATAHCVAKSLNFCRVAISPIQIKLNRLYKSVNRRIPESTQEIKKWRIEI